jgi:hypothetical protein
MLRKGDKILIILIVVSIAIGYGVKIYNSNKYKNNDSIAIIEINGTEYGKYDLKTANNKTLEIKVSEDAVSIVEFKDGKVRIKEAQCPDKVCVKTGWISKPGEVIVCLPYKIVIKISGERQDVDVETF